MAERSTPSPFDCGSSSMSDSFMEEMNRDSISLALDMSEGERLSPRTPEMNRFAEIGQDSGSSDSNLVTSTTSPNEEQLSNNSSESFGDQPSCHAALMDSAKQDDDVIFVASYPAPGPSNEQRDSDIMEVRGPYFPVQGPFLPPPLQGPSVPLNPEFGRLPDLVRDLIFRYARIAGSSTSNRSALNAEFLDLEDARIRMNAFSRSPAAPSRNIAEIPRTPSFFRQSSITIRRFRERARQEEISRRVRRIHQALARRRNAPFYFCRNCKHWQYVRDDLSDK